MNENKKYFVGLLGGINDTPTLAFLLHFDKENIILDCIKVKLFGSPKLLATYKIPYDRVITMELLHDNNIDDKEQHYKDLTGFDAPLFTKSREIIKNQAPLNQYIGAFRTSILSIVHRTSAGDLNEISLAVTGTNMCGVGVADMVARELRIELGIEKEAPPADYEQNEKGEFIL